MSKDLIARLRDAASVKSWADADAQRAEAADVIEHLARELETERCLSFRNQVAELEQQRDTAWAQAHRLALELECLLLDTKDNAVVSKWWDSGMEALSEYQELKPGAEEEAGAWASMRRSNI